MPRTTLDGDKKAGLVRIVRWHFVSGLDRLSSNFKAAKRIKAGTEISNSQKSAKSLWPIRRASSSLHTLINQINRARTRFVFERACNLKKEIDLLVSRI